MNVQAGSEMAAIEAIKANYSLTDEQRQIVNHFDRVSREVLHPLQEKMDAEEWWPQDLGTFPATRAASYCRGSSATRMGPS